MLGNDYTNSIFGIVTQTPGRIQINNFGSTPLSTSDWTDMIRLVAYRLVDVKLEVAGTLSLSLSSLSSLSSSSSLSLLLLSLSSLSLSLSSLSL